MPFAPNPVTTEQLVNALTDLYGSEVNTPQVRSTADSLKVSYATACKRLKSYKSGKGKWNLTAQEIERAYEAPSAQPATEVSTFLKKMIPSSSLATMLLLKRLFGPIGLSSLHHRSFWKRQNSLR